jgi:hypothetical protein
VIDLKHELERELGLLDPPDLWDRIRSDASDREPLGTTSDGRRRRPSPWLVGAAVAAAVLIVLALGRSTPQQEVETRPAEAPAVPDIVLPQHLEFGPPPDGQGFGRPPDGGLNLPAGEGLGGATMDLAVTGLDGDLSGEARIEGFSYLSNPGHTVVIEFECYETDATDLILGAIVTESTGANPVVGDRIAVLIRDGSRATVWWDTGLASCHALLDAVPHPRPDDRFVEIVDAEPGAG